MMRAGRVTTITIILSPTQKLARQLLSNSLIIIMPLREPWKRPVAAWPHPRSFRYDQFNRIELSI